MLSLIIFGVIALIAIVFLISFNIKTVSKPEKVKLKIDTQSEFSLPDAIVPQTELFEEQQLSKSLNKIDKETPQMSDEQYRHALRQFHSSQGGKSTTASINRLNDTAYRTAVRSMKNQTKKD